MLLLREAPSMLPILSNATMGNTGRCARRALRQARALPAHRRRACCGCRGRKIAPLAKSYLGNALHLLAHLAEEHTSAFILRRTRASVALLAPYDALQRRYLRVVLGLFGAARARKVRVQALLWLRAMAAALPARRGDVLRGAYRAYAAAARSVTPASMPDLAFMVAGIVELYGLDMAASYEQMFGFVAQLVRRRLISWT
jgi:nucleolar complex protein 2